MYGIAQWYIHTQKGPQVIGVSFVPEYAQFLGVEPKETLDALLGIGVKQLRLVSYWDTIEAQEGTMCSLSLLLAATDQAASQVHILGAIAPDLPRSVHQN